MAGCPRDKGREERNRLDIALHLVTENRGKKKKKRKKRRGGVPSVSEANSISSTGRRKKEKIGTPPSRGPSNRVPSLSKKKEKGGPAKALFPSPSTIWGVPARGGRRGKRKKRLGVGHRSFGTLFSVEERKKSSENLSRRADSSKKGKKRGEHISGGTHGIGAGTVHEERGQHIISMSCRAGVRQKKGRRPHGYMLAPCSRRGGGKKKRKKEKKKDLWLAVSTLSGLDLRGGERKRKGKEGLCGNLVSPIFHRCLLLGCCEKKKGKGASLACRNADRRKGRESLPRTVTG